MVAITISASGNRAPAFARKVLPLTIEVSPEDTIEDVKKKVAAKCPKFYTSRQKITLKSEKKPLQDEVKVKDVGLANGGDLDIKDLGPQLGWKFVFVVEYLGPLVIHPIFYHLPELVYGKAIEHSSVQNLTYAMVMLHFAKRELETLFVHRFSHGTMPARNIFKNSAHYHIFSGLLLALDVYRPKYAATSPFVQNSIMNNDNFLLACTGAWAFFEISNFITHVNVRNLRPAGSKKRAIPYGYGFNLVSFPNYLFEILGWTIVTVMTQSVAAGIFWVLGTGQMAIWAAKKHANYKKEFGKEYPRKRKAIFPWIF